MRLSEERTFAEDVPLPKRLCRAVFILLPATRLSFNLGKVITRTILSPKPPITARFRFAGAGWMSGDLGEITGNDLYCLDKHFESTTLKLWRRLAKDSRTILDLGSHIGAFALVAAAANPAARIIAVEPCRRNYRYLEMNTASFKNVVIFDNAIGTTGGTSVFEEGDSDGSGHLLDHSRDNSLSSSIPEYSYPVEVLTLSQLCQRAELPAVDLMKMDLEGMEYELLTGQDDFWQTFQPRHVIVEIGTPKKDSARLKRIVNVMTSRGYDHRRYQGLYAFPWKEKEDLANWYFWKK